MIDIVHRETGAVLRTVEGEWRTRIVCYAHLGAVDWRGANLAGANLNRTTLKNGRYDQYTLWPKGFVPAKHRLIYVPNTAKRPAVNAEPARANHRRRPREAI